MTVTARFYCQDVTDYTNGNPDGIKTGEGITLAAVYSSDPNSPNFAWSQATPFGQLVMSISNPAAFGQFVQGKEYDIVISPVYPSPAAPLPPQAE